MSAPFSLQLLARRLRLIEVHNLCHMLASKYGFLVVRLAKQLSPTF